MIILACCSVRQARLLHKDMVTSLIRAPINPFHNSTTKGTIINRLQTDLNTIDLYSLTDLGNITSYVFGFLGTVIVSGYIMPLSLAFFPLLIILGVILLVLYLPANRDGMRMLSSTRSPIITKVDETIKGTAYIRAYGLRQMLENQMFQCLDKYLLACQFFYGTQFWFNLYLDFCSWIFFLVLLSTAILFKSSVSPTDIGLLIRNSNSIEFWFFRFINNITILEFKLISMERCFSFVTLESENNEGSDFLNWPSQGEIRFNNFSTNYVDGPNVIKRVNLTIGPTEKVAIVGRTGSGKSTLCLGLLRILNATEGAIEIDGLDISKVNLKHLRNSITSVPQSPVLMKDSLRFNIDPLNKYSDEEIWEAAKRIHLAELIGEEGLRTEVLL